MRRLPPLHALRAFEAAARHLHFAKAAEELALTPTAISHQVKLLEDLLGHQLFIRFPRPMRLTPEGAKLFPVLRDGLDRFAEAIDGLTAAPHAEPISVSVPHSFGARWFVPRLAKLKEDTGLDVVLEADDKFVELHARTVDCAIRYPATPPKGLVAHAITSDRTVPVCTPALMAKHGGAPAKPSELIRLPLIHYRWKTSRRDAPSWERWLIEAESVEPGVASASVASGIRLSEEAHGIEAALAGQGVALASNVEVSRDVAEGRLVIPLDIGIPGLTFFLCHLKGHRRSAEMDALAQWMKKECLP
jgi:LysR family transcriptional regulator, glycine cleavage system transcriptional activator